MRLYNKGLLKIQNKTLPKKVNEESSLQKNNTELNFKNNNFNLYNNKTLQWNFVTKFIINM